MKYGIILYSNFINNISIIQTETSIIDISGEFSKYDMNELISAIGNIVCNVNLGVIYIIFSIHAIKYDLKIVFMCFSYNLIRLIKVHVKKFSIKKVFSFI